jgi:hypothetical protein
VNAHGARGRFVVAAVVATFAGWAGAQQAGFLVPEKAQAQVGEQLTLRLERGDALASKPVAWPANDVQWFFIRAFGTQENRDELKPARPADDFVRVPLEHAGVTVMGVDFKPIVATVPTKDFQAFMKRDGVTTAANAAQNAGGAGPQDAAKALAGQTVRVRRYESVKTIVTVADARGQVPPSATGISKTGQKVEILPLLDPTQVKPGGDLPVAVYINGSKKPDIKVAATRVGGAKENRVADPSGSSHFKVANAGPWRVEFHYVEPLTGDAQADWAIYSATVTFAVRGEGAGQ